MPGSARREPKAPRHTHYEAMSNVLIPRPHRNDRSGCGQAAARPAPCLPSAGGDTSTVAGTGYPAAYEGGQVMTAKVYLSGALAARSEMTYEEADAFSVTAGFLLLSLR